MRWNVFVIRENETLCVAVAVTELEAVKLQEVIYRSERTERIPAIVPQFTEQGSELLQTWLEGEKESA